MSIPEQIERTFAGGATIITANARAARWLEREYALRQKSMGRRAWATPPIADWETWLRQQWQARTLAEDDAPLLLTSLQERSVWMRMQREDAALLVSPASVAALAESAYALLSAYEAHSERSYTWGKTDAERFRQWAANFDRECARQNWMSRAGLEQKVAARLDAKELSEEILLLGFDRVTPAQDGLLRAIAACGARVQFAVPEMAEARTEFLRAAGLREEITTCARWVRALIEKDPETRIGVLVPELDAVRSEIERVFRRVLMPQSDDIFADQAMPFEFSLGQPLAHTPVVRAALLLLRWLHAPLREEEISWLLLSGFLTSGGAERLELAKIDARNRTSESLSLEIPLKSFLKSPGVARLPPAAKLERALCAASHIVDESRLPGRWTDAAQMLLREAGWPGAEQHGTLHFQALRRWERALDEIALLDFDGRQMPYEDFLGALEAHAQEMIFSPESHGVPVQVMGAAEASGQHFDAVWFLGADDASWPSRGRPHPLLPADLQRRRRMPYADAANDLELARAIMSRVAASAPVIVFSHAERDKDGDLRPSLLPIPAEWRDADAVPETRPTQTLEPINEAPGSIPWPQDRSPGGSEVLKDQAACPFRAFAKKRLHAEPLNRREWGLSAAQRGQLLHKTLENIWSPATGALHSLDDLRAAMRDGRLNGILSSAIAAAFAKFAAIEDSWMRAYLRNEQRRLHLRLQEWMKVEAERVPFRVSACEEELHDVSVGGLKLKLRADRIDELASGDRLLIDYKSGEVSPRDWEGSRPNEPQLPLYAVFGNVPNVRSALFARIRAGDICFSGSVADLNRQLLPDAKPTAQLGKVIYTEALREDWESALLGLAAAFLHGDAAVDPKDDAKTCRHCPLPALCRVAELRDGLDDQAEDEP